MPSKPTTDAQPAGRAGWLRDTEVLAVHGVDAADFLQRQTMNDVRQLAAVGDWHWNGVLSAKGRVLALFALLRCADSGFWLVLPDGDAAGWADALRRYVFRSKLTLAPLPAMRVVGRFGGADRAGALLPSRASEHDGHWQLDLGSPGRPRQWLVGDAIDAAEDPQLAASWHLENLRHGLPRITAEARDRHTPQMLGLDRLAAYSVKKGCYPGQEIVARTHFLGQAKRGIARLVAPHALADGIMVRCGEHETALLDRASDGHHHEALAVLPLESTAPCVAAGELPLERVPFVDGLARRPAGSSGGLA